MDRVLGKLNPLYQPLCSSSLLCQKDINSACYQNCPPCTRMFNLIPGESGDFRFTRYFFIQSSIQLFACILCLAFLWYSNRASEKLGHGNGVGYIMLPAHYGLLLLSSGLSFFNFLLSVAFAVTELQLAVTYTFLLYAPSSLAIGQICGILAYLLYPAAGQAAINRFWATFVVATAYFLTCYSIVMEEGRDRNLLILPIVVDAIGMVSCFVVGIIPNSVVFRRTGFRRLSLLLGIVFTTQMTVDAMHFAQCSTCAYCSFILQNVFLAGMVQPFMVLWSLLRDSMYWLGMANEMAVGADLNAHEKVRIDQPLVGISLDRSAASELAQSLGSRSMEQVALIPHNRLELNVHMSKLQLLGSGGTAKVYKGVYTDKSKRPKACAVKVSFFVEFNVDVIREVIREAALCGTIKNSRIVEFFGISVMPPSIALVFELCEHGSLEKFLRRGKGRLNEKNKLLLCLDCAMAVEYLHSIKSSDGLHFSHGDLKSPNFLVTRQGVVKLSDLATCSPSSTVRLETVNQTIDDREDSELPSRSGSSGKVEDVGGSNDFTQIRRVTTLNKLVGDSHESGSFSSRLLPAASSVTSEHNLRFAPQWTAPEMLRTALGTSSLSSDIYSLGVVFWEIFHQAEPFGDQPNLNSDPSELIKMLEKRQISLQFDPTLCEAAMVTLFESMTAFDPNKRPSAAEVSVSVLKMIDHENPEMFRVDIEPTSRSSQRSSNSNLSSTSFLRLSRNFV